MRFALVPRGGLGPPLRVVVLALAAMAIAAPGRLAARTIAADEEYRYKASFVLNVLQFTTWTAAPAGQVEIAIGVLGASAGSTVATQLAGKTVRGLPVVVRTFRHAADIRNCQVAFLTAEAPGESAEAIRRLDGQPVLTVTDADRHAGGAVIHVFVSETRLAFDVDLDAAARNGLHFGAPLLKLARRVSGGGSP